jgi:hypothetical protein
MILNIATDLQTRRTVWVATNDAGKQSDYHAPAADLAPLLQRAAYDRHGVDRNPRCVVSGWRSSVVSF